MTEAPSDPATPAPQQPDPELLNYRVPTATLFVVTPRWWSVPTPVEDQHAVLDVIAASPLNAILAERRLGNDGIVLTVTLPSDRQIDVRSLQQAAFDLRESLERLADNHERRAAVRQARHQAAALRETVAAAIARTQQALQDMFPGVSPERVTLLTATITALPIPPVQKAALMSLAANPVQGQPGVEVAPERAIERVLKACTDIAAGRPSAADGLIGRTSDAGAVQAPGNHASPPSTAS